MYIEYEYDPFGSMLRETGRPIAFEQPFRFATKTYDHETELCNFGFRHYHTSLGRFINRDPIEERGGWALFKGLNYSMQNPFYGNRSLNATNFLAEYGSRQDEGLKNTSLAHSTETIGTGQPKNSQAKWERDLNTKYYSANSSATGHVGQGGSSGIEWHTPDRSVRSADPWNRDANLYIYAGNDPINGWDMLGLWTRNGVIKELQKDPTIGQKTLDALKAGGTKVYKTTDMKARITTRDKNMAVSHRGPIKSVSEFKTSAGAKLAFRGLRVTPGMAKAAGPGKLPEGVHINSHLRSKDAAGVLVQEMNESTTLKTVEDIRESDTKAKQTEEDFRKNTGSAERDGRKDPASIEKEREGNPAYGKQNSDGTTDFLDAVEAVNPELIDWNAK